jgi:23S rRNA pseudouridine1911/1915/1917 synthase
MAANLSHLEIVSEDDHLIAIVKPAGLATANAAKGTPSVFTILQQSRPSGSFLGVVSRLDAPVSGILVMAKTRAAAAELSRQFRERLVEKTYAAVVEGRFPAALAEWVDWRERIERRGDERRSRLRAAGAAERSVHPEEADGAGVDEDEVAGGECHVRARVVKRHGEISLVELLPSTGRRHQLRVQLAGRGCPIVGDKVYGARLPFAAAPDLGPAIALHARRLAFVHPGTRQAVVLDADWPQPWQARFAPLLRGGHQSPGRDRGRQPGVN